MTAAATGKVGEIVTATASSLSLTASATTRNLTSISLTAGEWLVFGTVQLYNSSGITGGFGAITTPSAGNPGFPYITRVNSISASAKIDMAITNQKISLTATTSIYVTAQATYSSGTATASGSITAIRIR